MTHMHLPGPLKGGGRTLARWTGISERPAPCNSNSNQRLPRTVRNGDVRAGTGTAGDHAGALVCLCGLRTPAAPESLSRIMCSAPRSSGGIQKPPLYETLKIIIRPEFYPDLSPKHRNRVRVGILYCRRLGDANPRSGVAAAAGIGSGSFLVGQV